MSGPEEPEYQVFEYICPRCGYHYEEANSIRLHPDHRVCPKCGKGVKIETIITLAGKASQVFSYIALLAKHRGNATLGELNQ